MWLTLWFDSVEGFLNLIVYTWTTVLKHFRKRKQKKDTLSQQPTNDPTFKSGSVNSGAIDSGAKDVKSADESDKVNGNKKETSNENQQQQNGDSEKSSQESDHKGSPLQRTLTDQTNPKVIDSATQNPNLNPNPNPNPNLNPSDGQKQSSTTAKRSPIPVGY